MLQVRHVVRHGKGFIVFALARRCLPVQGADMGRPRSLNSNSSSSRSEAGSTLSAMNNTDTSGGLGDGEVLKAGKAPKSLDSSRGNHGSSRDSKHGAVPAGKSLREVAKDLISQFTKGTKVLWVDFKASRQTSARKKAGEALTFQEHRQLRQVCVSSSCRCPCHVSITPRGALLCTLLSGVASALFSFEERACQIS